LPSDAEELPRSWMLRAPMQCLECRCPPMTRESVHATTYRSTTARAATLALIAARHVPATSAREFASRTPVDNSNRSISFVIGVRPRCAVTLLVAASTVNRSGHRHQDPPRPSRGVTRVCLSASPLRSRRRRRSTSTRFFQHKYRTRRRRHPALLSPCGADSSGGCRSGGDHRRCCM
jgi:hypothetical protein